MAPPEGPFAVANRTITVAEVEVRPPVNTKFLVPDLQGRHHYTEGRVRAHLLICMLAFLVQCTMQQALAPLLFVDEDTTRAAGPGRASAQIPGGQAERAN